MLFDFSNTKEIHKAFSFFGNNNHFFPGTLISVYIPAIEDGIELNVSSIKPEVEFAKVKPQNEKYLSINSIIKKLEVDKEILYGTLLTELKRELCSGTEHSLVFVSFRGCAIQKKIIKKTLYFLLTDYEINHKANVVILHSPPDNITGEIASEILMLNDAIKNYKLHPLPIIDFDKKNNDLNITWLGIYNDDDKVKLNDLLYEQYSIAKTDFQDPANISGHLNEFDTHGNLISNFPSKNNIINFFKLESEIFLSKQVEDLLDRYDCIKIDDGKSLYLCNGNYYQKEYVELNNLIGDRNDCNTVTQLLFAKICERISDSKEYKFIGVTTSSHKILKSLEIQNLIDKDSYISLDNYHTFENDLGNEVVEPGKKYILICDVLSTGFLTKRIQTKVNELGATIDFIGVIVSTSDHVTSNIIDFSNEFKDKLISLYERKIRKFKRNEISQEVIEKDIIRVNPHTNIPIRLSINATGYNESIIFPSEISYIPDSNEIVIRNRFLESISAEAINVGFLKFNNVIHPYFFETDRILKNIDKTILKEIFFKIKRTEELKREKYIKVFYPRKSGIENFDFLSLSDVIGNDSIEEIEIERFGTPEGWKFPHNTNYLNSKIKNNFCFILDDGSCSGDSLIQMIDEISFYEAKEILLLCFIGRVNDHKREFFSRLANIKIVGGKKISLSIFFVCHWHIPTYYLDENPNIRETAWLNSIIAIQNTPQNIKEISKKIINAIKPRKRISDFEDYQHIPKIKGTNDIPKKDLLLIREELGKVIGYRLYKESFDFFDYLITKYEKRVNNKDRYKEIELLCGCFVYEPYLYEKIQGILPDVVDKIEQFVDVLIFNHQAIAPNLTYVWDKKDIIHLFFVVFKNEKLLEHLTKAKFIQLAQFTKQKQSALDYVLYKLLYYFPITNTEINIHSSAIKKLLLDVGDSEQLSNTAKTKIKVYRWFISSLPSSNTFQDFQSKLKANFEKIVDQKYHDDNIYNDKQIINSVLLDIGNRIRKGQTYENEVISIRTHWENIAAFIRDIVSFARSFPKFFIDEKLLFEIDSKENSLRKIYGELTEMIYNENSKGIEVGKKLTEIFVRFILDESQLLKIFSKLNTKNALTILDETFLKRIEDNYSINKIDIVLNTNIALDFPQYFFEIILRELYSNFRHIDSSKMLKISITKTSDNFLKIKIWNFLNDEDFVSGGNNGIKILKNLNNPFLKTYYKRYSRKINHLQVIKIKIL